MFGLLTNSKVSSIDIIGAVVTAMDKSIEIKTAVESPTGTWTLTCCDIKYAQPKLHVTIGGNNYKIQSVTEPNIMVVVGSAPITVTTFDLYPVFFKHGTAIATSDEISQVPKASDKTPFVWMMESYADRFGTDISHPIERYITFRCFFLGQLIVNDQKTDAAYYNVVRPMNRLCELFINTMKSQPNKFDLRAFDFNVINYAKLGVYITNKGQDTQLFQDGLGGCEVPFQELPIWESGLCEEC